MPDFDQAIAISRTVPLNDGSVKLCVAVPSGPTVSGPVKYATSSSVGGGFCSPTCASSSPPDRTAPIAPIVPSISRP